MESEKSGIRPHEDFFATFVKVKDRVAGIDPLATDL